MAKTFDGPPTLERSGSERRGGAVSSLFPEGERVGVILEKAALRAVTSFSFREGFLSPTRGTEGVVKTIEERLGEKGGALLTGETER